MLLNTMDGSDPWDGDPVNVVSNQSRVRGVQFAVLLDETFYKQRTG